MRATIGRNLSIIALLLSLHGPLCAQGEATASVTADTAAATTHATAEEDACTCCDRGPDVVKKATTALHALTAGALSCLSCMGVYHYFLFIKHKKSGWAISNALQDFGTKAVKEMEPHLPQLLRTMTGLMEKFANRLPGALEVEAVPDLGGTIPPRYCGSAWPNDYGTGDDRE